MNRTLALLPLVLALAACGGKASQQGVSTARAARPAAPSYYPDDPQVVARATTADQRRDLGLLWKDTQRVRRAAAGTDGSSLKGTPRVRDATSQFIEDLDRSSIDDLSKNRVIDHAAAAVAPVCGQCFQQLEAMRPIPAIAH
jgi:hypothetical protein